MPSSTNVYTSGVGTQPQTGTTTNDNASIGMVGEVVESNIPLVSAVTLGTGTTSNVTSIVLTAGDWDISGNVVFSLTGVTGTLFQAGVSVTSATMPSAGGGGGLSPSSYCILPIITTLLSATSSSGIISSRLSISDVTTLYLVAGQSFTIGTSKAYGSIWARRAR